MKAVFAFVMLGIKNPYALTSTNQVLYTTGPVSTSNLPAALTTQLGTFTVLEVMSPLMLPGESFGASPRKPVGSGGDITVTLINDTSNYLGRHFLTDDTAPFWTQEDTELSDSAGTMMVRGSSNPTTGQIYYLANESFIKTDTLATNVETFEIEMTRAACGSIPQTRTLSPRDYGLAAEGVGDALYMTSKPNWDQGFHCRLYTLLLDQNNEITHWMMRPGIVSGEPTPRGHLFDIPVRMLEDAIGDHEIGNASREVALSKQLYARLVSTNPTGIVTPGSSQGSNDGTASRYPVDATMDLTPEEAQTLFNVTLHSPGHPALDSARTTTLSTRLFQDSDVIPEIIINDGDTWSFRLTNLAITSPNTTTRALYVRCTLHLSSFSPKATLSGEGGDFSGNKPGWSYSQSGYTIPTNAKDNPIKASLRYTIHKNPIDAFLILACSKEGTNTSGLGYDILVGGFGAGYPETLFSIGSASGTPQAILGNTTYLKEMGQILNVKSRYPFDAKEPFNFGAWIANEGLAAQLMMGPVATGEIAFKSWAHEVAGAVTLNLKNGSEVVPIRLPGINRLDMTFGSLFDGSPQFARSFKWAGVSNVKPEQVQAIRLYDDGITLKSTTLNNQHMARLVKIYYKMFGGAPFVYPVIVSLEDWIKAGINFGDSVLANLPNVPTPVGVGLNSTFFIVGIDPNTAQGEVNLLLLENKINSGVVAQSEGRVSPAFRVDRVIDISTTDVYVDISVIGQTAGIDPVSDWNGLFDYIIGGSWLQVECQDQGFISTGEIAGSRTAHTMPIAEGSTYYKVIGNKLRLRLTTPVEYHRGAVTRTSDLFIPGETVLVLPTPESAAQNLAGNLIEPTVGSIASYENDFISLNTPKTTRGTLHTWGA